MRHWIAMVAACGLALAACKKQAEKRPVEPTRVEAKEPARLAEPAPADDGVLERGRYLADLMGCQQCHTPFGPQGPNTDLAYAGGFEIPEAFGTWRSPNISQDKDTGIGAWTDAQIITAVREGKRPDGDTLFPIMPYPLYNALSNQDAAALVTFLRTLPAIPSKVVRATDLKLPKIAVPPASGAEPAREDPVAYGGYLASLMHCALCHTPMDEKTHGMDMSRAFAGGFKFELPMFGEGALFSSNLTSDPKTGIGEWKDEEIANAVRAMTRRDGTLIQGPMAMYQQGWYRLEDSDLKAVIAFLRSLPPIVNEVPTSTFKPRVAPPGAPAALAPGMDQPAAPASPKAPAEPTR